MSVDLLPAASSSPHATAAPPTSLTTSRGPFSADHSPVTPRGGGGGRFPVHVCIHITQHYLSSLLLSVKRDLLHSQKRPSTVSKETYYIAKRDLLHSQKKTTIYTSVRITLNYLAIRRDSSRMCQKRPTTVSKETYYNYAGLFWRYAGIVREATFQFVIPCENPPPHPPFPPPPPPPPPQKAAGPELGAVVRVEEEKREEWIEGESVDCAGAVKGETSLKRLSPPP